MMIKKGLGACTLGVNEDGIILAFEGTVFTDDWQWLNDMLVATEPAWGVKGLVSSGFYGDVKDILDPIVTNVKSLMAQHPSLPLIITGHSKGASMAPIAACSLWQTIRSRRRHSTSSRRLHLGMEPSPRTSTRFSQTRLASRISETLFRCCRRRMPTFHSLPRSRPPT
ncbi:MAG: hypothetical protein IPK82_39510 [Polyangiaceae bacterium]|nr:hypothetical protein [Polyangiaceae bacterium]